MNDEIIQDLKQFIAATLSQQNSEMIERFDKVDLRLVGIEERFNRVGVKIDDLSTSVAEAIVETNDANDTQIQNHEQRLVKLVRKPA